MPVSGAWRLSFSMYAQVDSGDYNWAYLYLNGEKLTETYHKTYSGSGEVHSTGGRVLTVEASAGDKIEIRATDMDRDSDNILYCAEYIPKM